MLVISGVRDVGLKKQSPTSYETLMINGQSTKIAVIGKRYWIPAIGWCLAFAFLNNCGIYPYADVKIVEWAQILTGMCVLLGISGTRDIFLLRNKAFAEKIAGVLFKSDDESADKAKTETSEDN